MISARRLLAGGGVVLLLGAAALLVRDGPGSGGGIVPAEGTLAVVDASLASPWEEVARLTHGFLGKGGVVDVVARGDTVLILQRHQWMYAAEGAVFGPFGSDRTGAPDWMERGVSIAWAGEDVLTLDQARQEISRWDLGGNRVETLDVRTREAAASFPEALAADQDGSVVLAIRTMWAGGGGEWQVLRYVPGTPAPDTVYRADLDAHPSAAHNVPKLAVASDGSFDIAPALDWRFLVFGPDGRRAGSVARDAGPRWAVSDSIRRRYAGLMERIPQEQRRGLAMLAAWPPVRAVSALEGGSRLVLVSVDADDVHAEVVDADGRPVGRLWEDPEPRVFVSGGSVYRIREAADHSVVERQRIHR